MIRIAKPAMSFVVFVTGACILVIEVVAIRVLSPYFGNTIFSVSSVLGVVLAALSLGYYYGGRWADSNPSEKTFYSIILASGLSVLALHFLSILLLPLFAYALPITAGPLIASIVLFFLPGLLLGTLSPFAIKLQEQRFPEHGIGAITGGIFFWSTLGSIVGSLSTGFVLIPLFGIHQIMFGVAFVLIALGLLPLLSRGIRKDTAVKVLIFAIAVPLLITAMTRFGDSHVLFTQDGIYEKITIFDGELGGKPVRYFVQDRSNSGAMFLESDELVFDYTKYYALYKVFNPDVKRALVIGGGAYSIPKALVRDLPQAVIDVSEIEPSLFELAQKYFRLTDISRIRNFTEDGRRLLHDAEQHYDYIFSDVYYSLYSMPAHFTTREFFQIAKDALSENGVFIANLIGNMSRQNPSLIMSEIKTFQTVFANSYFFAVESPEKLGVQNIIFVGFNSDKKFDFSNTDLTSYSDLVLRSLREKQIDLGRFDLTPYPVLTDNYSPVEYLTSRVLRQHVAEKKAIHGEEMLALIDQQLRYGARYLTAPGHKAVQEFLLAEMKALTESAEPQSWSHRSADGVDYHLTNVIGRISPSNPKRIVVGTHYDTKRFADRDSEQTSAPVMGANDGASGVAVLIELARTLKSSAKSLKIGVDLVFFDGEEGEESQGGDYSNWIPLGSTYFVEHLEEFYGSTKPLGGIVLDMVCDRDLRLLKEKSSVQHAARQVEKFWEIGRAIDRNVFVDAVGAEIRDDHTAFNRVGVPSFLVIDLDYPPFHTIRDTVDKCSAESLETVANTLLRYLQTLE